MSRVSKTHKAKLPLEPVPINRTEFAYDRAVRRAKEGEPVNMPVSFNHPEHGRVAGTIRSMRLLPCCATSGLPDFLMTVEGRSGTSCEVTMLGSYAQVYHTFTEADENVAKYTSR